MFNKIYNRIRYLMPNGDIYLANKLRKGGAFIGEDFKIFGAHSVFIDDTRPYLLNIGNNVHISHGVVILTHDNSRSVTKNITGYRIGEGQETFIGNNVFIGINSIILMGSRIGNNTIIGAGSVVHGHFPDGVVIAGNPAKVISTISEHIENRKRKSFENAKECIQAYHKHTGYIPKEKDMKDFMSLFTKSDQQKFLSFKDFLDKIL